MNVRKTFGLPETGTKAWAETESIRMVIDALERLEPQKASYVAAFAFLLGRVAYSDQDVSQEEIGVMRSIVMTLGQLPEEQANLIVEMARQRNQLFGATENFLVTREFNRLADRDQKINLLDCLFAVSEAHDDISSAEENEIRQIATELGLTYREFSSVRSTYRERLLVLKNTAG